MSSPAGRSVSPPSGRDRHLAEAGVLMVMALWAGNFIAIKGALDVIPPIAFTFLRFSLACVILLAVLRWREGTIAVARRDLPALIALGILGFGLYQILWTTALGGISAGDSAVLIATSPVMTALLSVALGTDSLTPAKLIGALVSFAGAVVVIAAGTGLDLAGEAIYYFVTLLAAACWATYSAFGGPILRRHSPLRATTWATLVGTAVMAVPGLLQLSTVNPAAVGANEVIAIVYSGTLAAGIGNVVVLYGVGLLGPTRVTALQTLVPALAVILAFLILAEPIRPGQVLGGAIILVGVALTRFGPRGRGGAARGVAA